MCRATLPRATAKGQSACAQPCQDLVDLALASFDELGHNSRATACTVLNLHPSKNLLHAKLAPDLVQRVPISRQSTICLVSNREAVQVFFQDVRLVAHSFGLHLFSFETIA